MASWLEDQLDPDTYHARASELRARGVKEAGFIGVVCPICHKEQLIGSKVDRRRTRHCLHEVAEALDILQAHGLEQYEDRVRMAKRPVPIG